MVIKHKTHITTLESVNTELQKYAMKDLNPFHFAIIDNHDRYYKKEEYQQYIDIKVVYN